MAATGVKNKGLAKRLLTQMKLEKEDDQDGNFAASFTMEKGHSFNTSGI